MLIGHVKPQIPFTLEGGHEQVFAVPSGLVKAAVLQSRRP
jgi:hypothetical protein